MSDFSCFTNSPYTPNYTQYGCSNSVPVEHLVELTSHFQTPIVAYPFLLDTPFNIYATIPQVMGHCVTMDAPKQMTMYSQLDNDIDAKKENNTQVVQTQPSQTRAAPYQKRAPLKQRQEAVSPSSSNSEQSKYSKQEALAMLDNPTIIKEIDFDLKDLCDKMFVFFSENKRHIEISKPMNQTNFAEHILNRTQGSLSELLNHPKPWDAVSMGRTVYQRMFNWLEMSEDDRAEIWKLDLKKEKADKTTKTPRARCLLSQDQKSQLSIFFETNPRPDSLEMKQLGSTLNLCKSTIINYFTNMRRRKATSSVKMDHN
ncbi:One cut domain family member [Caenorhabditis elegans]|uniref:One cut domain family member n=1 Tax=Caenorhabditis elegans TaxID=6239 RepID=O16218_CAEEL|nr:One cut domain family member [Caenorhabditis elegans]CCD69359.1 One cut domain family member [Caenorhabditis elegans]|eukprot:NP_504581.1 One cut domain family member [Caenorhabditis elegans]